MKFLHSKTESPQELKEDISIRGVASDKGAVFRKGTRFAPDALRKMSQLYVYPGMNCVFDPESGKYVLEDAVLRDYGNIRGNNRLNDLIVQSSHELFRNGSFVLTLGGDHSITYPIVQSYAQPLQILHLDAHGDVQCETEVDAKPCGTVMRRVSQLDHITKITMVGLRGYLNSGQGISKIKAAGHHVVPANQVKNMRTLFSQFDQKVPIYITLDADVLDPSICPGVSTPEMGGLSYAKTNNILKYAVSHYHCVGMDVVEYNPVYDPSQIGAACLTRLIINTLAANHEKRESFKTSKHTKNTAMEPTFISDPKGEMSSCYGPVSTLMAIQAWKPQVNLNQLLEIMHYNNDLWFFETYIVRAAVGVGLHAQYLSTAKLEYMENNPDYFKRISGLDFNDEKNRLDVGVSLFDEGVHFVKSKKLYFQREISVAFVRSLLEKGYLVIVTINRNVLLKKDGYKGHFMLLKKVKGDAFIANDGLFGKDFLISSSLLDACFYYIDRTDPRLHVRDLVVLSDQPVILP